MCGGAITQLAGLILWSKDMYGAEVNSLAGSFYNEYFKMTAAFFFNFRRKCICVVITSEVCRN